MSLALLSLLAAVQAVFLVFLVITLVVGRGLRARRRGRLERETDRLAVIAHSWLAERTTSVELAAALARARPAAVLEVIQRVSAGVSGEAWERLVTEVRAAPWLDRILDYSKSPAWWRRLSAAQAIALIARNEDLPVLERLIRDPNPVVQLTSVNAMRRVHCSALVDTTLQLAGSSGSVVRHFLLEALAESPGLDVELIRRRLAEPRSEEEARTLMDFVQEVARPEFLADVIPHAAHPNLEVRISLARVLGRLPHPAASDTLCRLLADEAWQVRAQAAVGLGAIGAREAAGPLRDALCDPSWWVRLRAALALRRLGEEGIRLLRGFQPEEDRYGFEMSRYVLDLDDAAVAEYGGLTSIDYTEVLRPPRAA